MMKNKFRKTKGQTIASILLAFMMVLFVSGAAFASSTYDTPEIVTTDSTTLEDVTTHPITATEFGTSGFSTGQFTITIPTEVDISEITTPAGYTAQPITRDETTLGSEGDPKKLYVFSDSSTTPASKYGTGSIFLKVKGTYAPLLKIYGSAGTNGYLTYGTGTTSYVRVAKINGGCVTKVDLDMYSSAAVGTIYYDPSAGTTVLTLTGAPTTAQDKIVIEGLTLRPHEAGSVGTATVALGNDSTLPLGLTEKSFDLLKMTTQPAFIEGTASTGTVPSVQKGAANGQPMGRVLLTLVGAADADNNTITLALDNGAEFMSNPKLLASDITVAGSSWSVFTDNSSATATVVNGKYVIDLGSTELDDGTIINIGPSEKAVVDALGVTTTGNISATVTGTGDFASLSGTVVVANAMESGVDLSFQDDTTTGFTKLYTGRTNATIDEELRFAETAPGSLIANKSFTLSVDQGAKFTSGSSLNFTRYTESPYTDTSLEINGSASPATVDAPTTASDTVSTYVSAASSGSPGAYDISNFSFDLSSATPGDLTITVGGDAGAAGTIKMAEILDATTTTIASQLTVIPSSTVTIPDITVTENAAGALETGYIGFKFPASIDLDETVTPTVTINGTAKTGLTAYGTGSTNVVWVNITSQSTATTGADTIVVSGLKAAATSAATGELSFNVGGSTNTAYSAKTFGSDAGAKPTAETVTFANAVSSTIPFIGTAAVTDNTVSQTFIPASGNIGQVGDMYIFTSDGQYYDGTAWGTTEAAEESGVVLGETTVTYPVGDLASGVKVYVGYGVGVQGTFATLNSNGTFGIGYTVPLKVSVDPATAAIDVAGTATITVSDGTAPYTIASSDETVATVSAASLDAAGTFDITGVIDGNATVTVTDADGKTATVAVTVGAGAPTPPTPAPVKPTIKKLTGDEIADAPVNMGSVATGTGSQMQLAVNFPAYDEPVDIYVGVQLPDGTLFLLDKDGKLTPDLVPYATGVTDAKTAAPITSFDVCLPLFGNLFNGTWYAYSVVAPTNGGDFTDIDWITGAYDLQYYSFDVSCGE